MKPSLALDLYRERIREIVRAHNARNPRVFGSVVHGRDAEGSDLDILVDPNEGMTYFDLMSIALDVKALAGIEVDAKTPKDLSEKFRDEVLAEARPI
jgi:predicted nucleotidyltransferase